MRAELAFTGAEKDDTGHPSPVLRGLAVGWRNRWASRQLQQGQQRNRAGKEAHTRPGSGSDGGK